MGRTGIGSLSSHPFVAQATSRWPSRYGLRHEDLAELKMHAVLVGECFSKEIAVENAIEVAPLRGNPANFLSAPMGLVVEGKKQRKEMVQLTAECAACRADADRRLEAELNVYLSLFSPPQPSHTVLSASGKCER